MKIVHHTAGHLIMHLALFAGFALLQPSFVAALEASTSPWNASPHYFWIGVILVLVSAFVLYRLKETIPDTLKAMGATVFIPGGLTLIFGFVTLDELLGMSSISGNFAVQSMAEWYVSHSVPTIMSVAAAYLFVGGMLYWAGHKIQTVKDKFSWS
ncbi:hypothetical protein COV18_04655 [Candidatus Woesearchaeota archaeon CG10_big_fil_rev_8_21_14_0_10_37_12]|nr:MAG: hypothetical protein COV18_04655 [Candidatus Woesearchaeota archaeon CG10_big_fil_rev_8_21_14_0_10_37_12]